LLIAILLAWAGAGCVSMPPPKRSPAPPLQTKPLWLLSNGFHSAIALRAADAGPWVRSLTPDRDAEWIAIGWGQADFFLARRYSLAIFLKAAFLPTRSALHVIPMRRPPSLVLARSDVIRVEIPAERMRDIRVLLESSLKRDDAGRPIVLGPGYFAGSTFYRGRQTFLFSRTCNLWSARVFRAGGVPISTPSALLADDLARQVALHGRRVGWKKKPVDGF